MSQFDAIEQLRSEIVTLRGDIEEIQEQHEKKLRDLKNQIEDLDTDPQDQSDNPDESAANSVNQKNSPRNILQTISGVEVILKDDRSSNSVIPEGFAVRFRRAVSDTPEVVDHVEESKQALALLLSNMETSVKCPVIARDVKTWHDDDKNELGAAIYADNVPSRPQATVQDVPSSGMVENLNSDDDVLSGIGNDDEEEIEEEKETEDLFSATDYDGPKKPRRMSGSASPRSKSASHLSGQGTKPNDDEESSSEAPGGSQGKDFEPGDENLLPDDDEVQDGASRKNHDDDPHSFERNDQDEDEDEDEDENKGQRDNEQRASNRSGNKPAAAPAPTTSERTPNLSGLYKNGWIYDDGPPKNVFEFNDPDAVRRNSELLEAAKASFSAAPSGRVSTRASISAANTSAQAKQQAATAATVAPKASTKKSSQKPTPEESVGSESARNLSKRKADGPVAPAPSKKPKENGSDSVRARQRQLALVRSNFYDEEIREGPEDSVDESTKESRKQAEALDNVGASAAFAGSSGDQPQVDRRLVTASNRPLGRTITLSTKHKSGQTSQSSHLINSRPNQANSSGGHKNPASSAVKPKKSNTQSQPPKEDEEPSEEDNMPPPAGRNQTTAAKSKKPTNENNTPAPTPQKKTKKRRATDDADDDDFLPAPLSRKKQKPSAQGKPAEERSVNEEATAARAQSRNKNLLDMNFWFPTA
ncbi:hypothetical protein Q7P37_009644 [Cladosporium fusiforme]